VDCDSRTADPRERQLTARKTVGGMIGHWTPAGVRKDVSRFAPPPAYLLTPPQLYIIVLDVVLAEDSAIGESRKPLEEKRLRQTIVDLCIVTLGRVSPPFYILIWRGFASFGVVSGRCVLLENRAGRCVGRCVD
jgi:hypothetical protein